MGRCSRASLLAGLLLASVLGACFAQETFGEDGMDVLKLVPDCGDKALSPDADDCVLNDIMGESGRLPYFIEVPDLKQDYGLLFTLRVQDGRADFEVTSPLGGKVYVSRWINPPKYAGNFNELFIRIPANESEPGRWKIMVKGGPRQGLEDGFIFYYLRVQTAPVAMLEKTQREALKHVNNDCCTSGKAHIDTVICSSIMKGILTSTSKDTDLCQTGNFVCDTKGNVRKLSLGFGGLECGVKYLRLPSFPHLWSLELDGNNFLGSELDTLSKELANTTDLQRLFIRQSSMAGTFPCDFVENHKKLRSLYVGTNPKVTGSLPSCVMASTSLEELSFAGTAINGEIPDVIPENSQLQLIHSNTLSQAPKGHEAKTMLEMLRPGAMQTSTGLTGSLPSSLKNARRLLILSFPYHQLSGTLPELPNSLMLLRLPFNKVEGQLPKELPEYLVAMDMTNNSLTGPLPDFNSAKNLGVVNLDFNQITGSLPESFGAAAQSIVQLSVGGNRLEGEISNTNWAEVENLVTLALAGNNLGGALPGSLGGLRKLQFLSLAKTGLTGDLEAFAAAIPHMDTIKVTKGGQEAAESPSGRRLREVSRKLLAPDAKEENATVPAPAKAAPAPAKEEKAAPAPAKEAPAPAKAAPAPAEEKAAPAPAKAAPAPAKEEKAAPAPAKEEKAAPVQAVEHPVAHVTSSKIPEDKNITGPALGVTSQNASEQMEGSPMQQSGLYVDKGPETGNASMREGDTAAQKDYWKPDDAEMQAPADAATRANSFVAVDLSNNQLTGTIPSGIYNMNLFKDENMWQTSPFRAYNRMLDLSNNNLQGAFPTEVLVILPVLEDACGPNGCITEYGEMLNLRGNDFYCPSKDVLDVVKKSLEAEQVAWSTVSSSFQRADCIVSGKPERENLGKYLESPDTWVAELPESAYAVGSSSQQPKKSNTGAIVGAVIGVVAAVAIIGALGFFAWRKFKGPRAYRKNEVPDYVVDGPRGAAAGVL